MPGFKLRYASFYLKIFFYSATVSAGSNGKSPVKVK